MSATEFQRRMRKIMRNKPRVPTTHPESVTPLRVVDAEPGFPEEHTKAPLLSAGEILEAQPPQFEYIVEGLLPTDGNVLIRIDPEVDAQMFAVQLGAAVAGGVTLPPYGAVENGKTVIVFKSGNLNRIREHVQLATERFALPPQRRALRQLYFYHPKIDGKKIEYLNSHYEQAELLNSLPDECKLLIVYDTAGFMATKSERELASYKSFASYLKKLNSQGIATVVFFQSSRKAYAGHEEDLVMDAWHNVIDLTPWPGAPREFGGGFSVSQRKVSEFGTVPSRYNYWYTVIDGKLASGFECVDSNDTLTIKQVEMAERQMRVKEMLARGIQHKTIAAQLGVDAATISRDVAKIKASEWATTKPSLSDLDEVGSE